VAILFDEVIISDTECDTMSTEYIECFVARAFVLFVDLIRLEAFVDEREVRSLCEPIPKDN